MGMQDRATSVRTHKAILKTKRHKSGAEFDQFRGFVDGPFAKEDQLEQWVFDHFDCVVPTAIVIGRQMDLGTGFPVDLLGLLPTGDFCIVELKRDEADIDDLAQLLNYAGFLDQLVQADLDRLVSAKHGQSLAAFYSSRFNKEFPSVRPRFPRLVLVAADVPPLVESLILFLNQRHRCNFQAISYLTPASESGERELNPVDVIKPGEELSPAGPIPSPLFLFRHDETTGGLWSQVKETSIIPCGPGEGQHMILKGMEQGSVTLLIYLHRCGYVGLATILKDKTVRQKRDDGGEDLLLKLVWDVFLPRERALFQTESWQPNGQASPMTDPELWESITSRLRFRSRSRRKLASHGAKRRPYKSSKPGTGN